MEKLVFDLDWLDGEGIQAPELAATFARFQLRVGDEVLTRAHDRETNQLRDHLLVPLYPLAEWVASNWWALKYEPENPSRTGQSAFQARHSLRAGREGYAYPHVAVVSWGARTRIVSATDPMPRPNSNLSHVEQRTSWVRTDKLFDTLSRLIEQVLRRLDSLGVTGTALEEEWAAIRSADEAESSFCRAAGRLGWDPYAIDDRQRDQVLVLAERLGVLFDEAAPILDPRDHEADCHAIMEALEEARGNALPLRHLEVLSQEGSGPRADADLDPERAGSTLAERLRQALGAPAEPLRTWEKLASTLGVEPKRLEAVLRPRDRLAEVPTIDGIVTRDEDGPPAFAFAEHSAQRLRLSFCRALAEVVTAPGTNALVTKALTDRQERSHAFAAELLAPTSWLAERISEPVVRPKTIAELATDLDVATRVVVDQLIRHRIARVRPFDWGGR